MSDWKTFESTVSPESWKRIKDYIESAQEECTLDDYPGVSSWHEMASVLAMHENNLPAERYSGFDDLIKDYKTYLEAVSD